MWMQLSFYSEDISEQGYENIPVQRPFFQDYPGEPVPERQNQSGFYWSKRQWVAVASAGSYASLHLAPDRSPCQYPTTQFFTGRMPFLPPNQQRQSTEGLTRLRKILV